MKRTGLFCLLLLLSLCVCKKVEKAERFARIGSKVYMKEDFDAFMKMRNQYPAELGGIYPGERPPATLLVETEVLFRKAWLGRGKVKNSGDWKWKSRYFPAQMYLESVIIQNSGFTDKQISAYYKANLDSFKVVTKVPVTRDSTQTGPQEEKDSVYHRPLGEVKADICQKLFCTTYPPDSAFFAEITRSTGGSGQIDSAMVRQQWFYRWRRDLPNFFMKKEFSAQLGKPMPDSLKEWYGDGKVITPADVEVIMGWLREDRRDSYRDEAGIKFIAEWLLKWKLFSEKAKQTGFSRQKDVASVVNWAWKMQVALDYAERKLIPKAQGSGDVDTAMCVFAALDKYQSPSGSPDSADLARTVTEYSNIKIGIAFDKMIAKLRKSARVEFLQSDWKDERDNDPAAMMASADALFAADSAQKAESIYRDIYSNFAYTPEGIKSLTEMAKIQTEKGQYNEAIANYRRYSIFSGDTASRCNTFFMIGFIYDEYLNRPKNAEVHYKWILKNTPECELTDDAEFMCLHLDEPMTSVEELQAEARRQGRKIDFSEPVSETPDSAIDND